MKIQTDIKKFIPFLLLSSYLLAFTQHSIAQEWPTQPIKFIVPFPAAGGTDALARALGNQLSKQLKQPVIIENKAGANGVIGAQAMTMAAPDGYTFLITIASHSIAPAISAKLPYNVDTDFAPVSLVAKYPYLLTVGAQSDIKTFSQLIQYAKAHPNKLSFASSGNGSGPHLGMELIADMAGIKLTHVPYKGAAPANNDLLSGNVDMMLNNLLASASLIRAEKLRVLAVTSAKRSTALPNVPTIKELGFPQLEVDGWYGVFAPAKTPDYIVQRLSIEIKKAIQEPDILARLNQDGAIPITSTPKEFQTFFNADKNRWQELVNKIKLVLD